MKLSESFYKRKNVVTIARELLGKGLFTSINGHLTGGIIVETEAYSWKERGCHAFGKKKTKRNTVMFGHGGYTYVYQCYGIHYLFNVVTNLPEVPEAVLVRAIQPITGQEVMAGRRGPVSSKYQLTSGPGKLTKALGIDKSVNGFSLEGNEVWIEETDNSVPARSIVASPRVGIDYAGEDAKLPWRFSIRENLWVSR